MLMYNACYWYSLRTFIVGIHNSLLIVLAFVGYSVGRNLV